MPLVPVQILSIDPAVIEPASAGAWLTGTQVSVLKKHDSSDLALKPTNYRSIKLGEAEYRNIKINNLINKITLLN